MEGKLIIFSAPSGSGKTTIVKHLLDNNSNLGFSISACTRPKRSENEQDGKDYYFLTAEEFIHKIAQNDFAEWEEVYPGAFYGTLKQEIERIWALGKHVIFDVDVKGGMKLKAAYGEKALSIFVKIPSLDVLEHRLRARNTESEEKIQERLSKASQELDFMKDFDVILLNETLEKAFIEAQNLLDKFI